MVDIHSHILPQVDDGARSWEMAEHMCHMAAEDGVTHMVATPHANDEFLYDRPQLESLLTQLSDRVGAILNFSLGCDFHFSYENLSRLQQDPRMFTIGSTPYMLVELSDFSIPPWVTTKLHSLLAAGLRPIITHPERNLILQKRPEQVLQWAALGCPIQVTAGSLSGRWGEKALKISHWLLQRDAVHLIASDCHNVEGRPPVLSAARKLLQQDYGADIAMALVADNPQAVVTGIDLPYLPRPRH